MGIPPNRSSMIVAVTRNGASVTAFFPAVTHLARDSLAIEWVMTHMEGGRGAGDPLNRCVPAVLLVKCFWRAESRLILHTPRAAANFVFAPTRSCTFRRQEWH